METAFRDYLHAIIERLQKLSEVVTGEGIPITQYRDFLKIQIKSLRKKF